MTRKLGVLIADGPPGPPPSQLEAYLEAEAEMQRAGCDVPGAILPGPSSR